MLAITVILATTVSVFAIGMVEDMSQDSPLVTFETEKQGGEYIITHSGGESIESSKLYVVTGSSKMRWSEYQDSNSTVRVGDNIGIDVPSSNQGMMILYSSGGYSSVLYQSTLVGYSKGGGSDSDGVLDTVGSVAYSGLEALTGDGERVVLSNTSAVDAFGSFTVDIDGDGTKEIPYVDNGNLKAVNSSGNTETLVSDTSPSNPDTDKTRLATGAWKTSDASVYYVNENHNTIYRVSSGGSVSKIATLSNGANAVSGIDDIDGDNQDELIFADGSQQLRYIDKDGSVSEIQNGAVGSNNGIGVGGTLDSDSDGTARVVTIDGSNKVRLVGVSETDKVFSSTSAAKSPPAVADVDDDNSKEIVYLSSNGNIRYIDKFQSQPTLKDLKDSQGDTISGSKSLGVVSA
jgi:hypothetical protein